MSKKNNRYKKSIIKALYFNDLMSSAELSNALGLSVPLISKLLVDLVGEGIIVEAGLAPSKGGRRPLAFSLRGENFFIVSVAMDQFVTRVAILTTNNRVLGKVESIHIPLVKRDSLIEELVLVINGLVESCQISKEQIVGVGVGMPGFVSGAKGINYSFLEVSESSLAAYLTERLEMPVFIENDSSVIALAELRFGAAKRNDNAMVINIGWGVGLGLIINNSLFRGSSGFAGEFSHIPLFSNNKLCDCGKRGCLETETSLYVMVQSAIEGLREGRLSSLSLETLSEADPENSSALIIEAAKKGDQFSVELISNLGYNIGRGVSVLIHLLNPEAIILGGRGSMAGKLWQAPIQQSINEHCIPRLGANTSIVTSELGHDAEVIGAAALVMENYDNEEFNNKYVNVFHRKSNIEVSQLA